MRFKTNIVIKSAEFDINIDSEVEMSLEELINTNEQAIEVIRTLFNKLETLKEQTCSE